MKMKRSLCIIDDDKIYQIIMRKLVNKSEFFELSKSYMEAATAIVEFSKSSPTLPDVILLDINMPVINGWEFLKQMQESRPGFLQETSVYIVTSSVAKSDRLKAENYKELSGFLSKPVSLEDLKEIWKEKNR